MVIHLMMFLVLKLFTHTVTGNTWQWPTSSSSHQSLIREITHLSSHFTILLGKLEWNNSSKELHNKEFRVLYMQVMQIQWGIILQISELEQHISIHKAWTNIWVRVYILYEIPLPIDLLDNASSTADRKTETLGCRRNAPKQRHCNRHRQLLVKPSAAGLLRCNYLQK